MLNAGATKDNNSLDKTNKKRYNGLYIQRCLAVRPAGTTEETSEACANRANIPELHANLG